MPLRKKNRRRKSAPSQSSNGCFADNFEALIRIVGSPEGTKPSLLKKLYCLLVHFSLNVKWVGNHAVGSNNFDHDNLYCGDKLKFGDVRKLSDSLYTKLEERFETIFSALFDMSANKDIPDHILFHDVEVVNLLLRCCMLLLSLLTAQQNVMLEKVQILLRILKRLCSPILVEDTRKHNVLFNKSIVRQCVLSDDGFTTSSTEHLTTSLQFLDPHNPLLFLTSNLLEVFVDELSVHGHLRGCFKMIDSIVSTSDMLFNPHPDQEDIGVVMEIICNHFILSFSDNQTFGDFLGRLFSLHAQESKYSSRGPALSVTTAVSLLFSPVMTSAPKFMQAHMISLVSQTTEAVMNIQSLKPDRKLINCFLVMFERSVILYKMHVSYLRDGSSTSACGSATSSSYHETAHPYFDSLVSSNTKRRLDSLISKLNHASTQNIDDRFFRMNTDLASSALRAMKEFHNSYTMSCHDEILAILSGLIHKVSANFHETTMHSIMATAMQDIYLLASLLKLMSSSLLQVIWCLRHDDGLSCLKTLKDFSSCKEYDFILSLITCFKYFPVNLPLPQFLSTVMSSHSARHKESKMMLLHFSGLMSLSFDRGIDCLVKGCLLTILALLNLFIFEEGELDALRLMIDSKTDPFSSEYPVFRFKETIVDQNSSLEVASRFQKIRSIHTRVRADENKYQELENVGSQINFANELHMDAVVGLEEETEETCTGEIFLNCMLKKGDKTSDLDDLVDFVECKKGKDYSVWLKNRKRYRKWRSEKIAVLKWKRKKRTWRTVAGHQP